LLKKGANPNIRDNQGNIPLDNIIEKPNILQSVLIDLIASGMNPQLIKEDNWRSLKETFLKTPVIIISNAPPPPFPSSYRMEEQVRYFELMRTDRMHRDISLIFLNLFDGGRRMTTEDLPLLQKRFQCILTYCYLV